MPLPLLAAAIPAWMQWLLAGGASWYGAKKFGEAREEGFRKKVPDLPEYSKRLMATPEYAEREARRRAGGMTALERRQEEERRKAKEEEEKKGKPTRWGTISEGGWIYEVAYDAEGNILNRTPLGRTEDISPAQKEQWEKEEKARERDEKAREEEWAWKTQSSEREEYWRKENARLEQERFEEEMAWRQEESRMRQQEQERQYRSQLMANPMSWLQYSSYTGQTPVIQEWMKPLMSGQYQTGQTIPGWAGGGAGQREQGQAMGSLPELRTPSAQLWGRMGPTAQAQYMGYGQTRTGIRPEETAFRLWATAPPSGRFGGLRRMR